MSLFSLFRKPAWEHQDPVQRQAAVARETHPDLIARLPELARQDSDAGVRQAALRRLDDLPLIVDRFRHDDDATVRDAARQRYLQRLLDASQSLEVRQRLLAVEEDADILAIVAQQATESALRRLGLERSTRAGLLTDRCIADPDPEIRRWLLDRIDDIATLERIAERVRKTDKTLARTARERARTARLAAGEPDAVKARALELCDELAALRGSTAEDIPAQRDRLRSEWQSLKSHLDAAMERRVEGYFDALEAFLSGPPVPTEPETPPLTPHPIPSRERDLALAALLAETEHRLERLGQKELEGLEKRWQTRCDEIAPLLPEESELANRFHHLIRRRKQEIDALVQQRQAILASLPERIQALATAVEAGALAEARELRQTLEADRQLLGSKFPHALSLRLGHLSRELERLDQWQRWSGNKARLNLIDEAEVLIGSGLHPDAIAHRIKELNTEWQALDEGENRPSDSQPHPLSRRFHAICRQALAPARGYFEKRREVREQQREVLDNSLTEIETRIQETTAIRGWLTLRRQIRDLQRQVGELDPSAQRPLRQRLRTALDQVMAAITASEAEGEAAKRKLLAALRRDLMHADFATALPLVRDAQSTWKNLPRAARTVDDALWKELRELVDPWFAQADQQQRERQATEAATQEQARTILAELEQLAIADATTLLQADTRLTELGTQWRALAPQRHTDSEPSERRPAARKPAPSPLDERAFDRAVARVRDAQAQAQKAASHAELMQWLELSSRCSQWERSPAEDRQAQRSELEAMSLARDAQTRLLARLDAHDSEDHAQRARELIVMAELSQERESPAEDRELRRRLQLERLSQHLSEGGGHRHDLRALMLDYISLPGISQGVHQALLPRWEALLNAMQ